MILSYFTDFKENSEKGVSDVGVPAHFFVLGQYMGWFMEVPLSESHSTNPHELTKTLVFIQQLSQQHSNSLLTKYCCVVNILPIAQAAFNCVPLFDDQTEQDYTY
jgi:hypothetical protein